MEGSTSDEMQMILMSFQLLSETGELLEELMYVEAQAIPMTLIMLIDGVLLDRSKIDEMRLELKESRLPFEGGI